MKILTRIALLFVFLTCRGEKSEADKRAASAGRLPAGWNGTTDWDGSSWSVQ